MKSEFIAKFLKHFHVEASALIKANEFKKQLKYDTHMNVATFKLTGKMKTLIAGILICETHFQHCYVSHLHKGRLSARRCVDSGRCNLSRDKSDHDRCRLYHNL